MTPVLVTPPAQPVITLAEAKAHLRVDIDAEDSLIEGMVAAATAHLDGWRGVLGRAIMPQAWRETHDGAGPFALALPDVTAVTASAGGAATITATPTGPVVELAEAVDGVTLTYTCALPPEVLPSAQMAVKLFLSHLYDQTDLSPAFDAIVGALRWSGV